MSQPLNYGHPRVVYNVPTNPAYTGALTLATVKRHLVVDGTEDDSYIGQLIAAAALWAQHFTNIQTLTTTIELVMDGFPSDLQPILLYRYPVTAITSIQYVDDAGNTQTFDSSKYHNDLKSAVARIQLNDGESWPTVKVGQANAVTVEFVAGYTAAAAFEAAKPMMVVAMWSRISQWYHTREDVVLGTIATQVPTRDESRMLGIDQQGGFL